MVLAVAEEVVEDLDGTRSGALLDAKERLGFCLLFVEGLLVLSSAGTASADCLFFVSGEDVIELMSVRNLERLRAIGRISWLRQVCDC